MKSRVSQDMPLSSLSQRNSAANVSIFLAGAIESGYRAASEILKEVDPTSLTPEDRELLAKAHPKKGFPSEKPSWKVVTKRRFINGGFFLGLAAGVLLAANQTLISGYFYRLIGFFHRR